MHPQGWNQTSDIHCPHAPNQFFGIEDMFWAYQNEGGGGGHGDIFISEVLLRGPLEFTNGTF